MPYPPFPSGRRLSVAILGWALPVVLTAAAEVLTLRSDELVITVATRGAELQSIVDRASGHEYLWQNLSKDWQGPAPVLFPVIGGVAGRTITMEGKSYPMPGHGFARSRLFTVAEHGPDSAALTLQGGGDGDPAFPCPYVLTLRYQLTGRTLLVEADIANPGPAVLPISIGFHPGFNVTIPAQGEAASRLEVESTVPLIQVKKDAATGFLTGERSLWSAGRKILSLTPTAPAPDAIVLANAGKLQVTLVDEHTRRRIRLHTSAPFFGVWRKITPTAQFICLEPWWGTTDPLAPYGDFRAKPHLALIAPGAKLSAPYRLDFD